MKLSKSLRDIFAASTIVGLTAFSGPGYANDVETVENDPSMNNTTEMPKAETIMGVMISAGVPSIQAWAKSRAMERTLSYIEYAHVDKSRAVRSILRENAIKGMKEKIAADKYVSAQELIEAGIDAALNKLDPHSDYFRPDELKKRTDDMNGQFGGLGFSFKKEDKDSPIEIKKLTSEDTPAAKAGLKVGDKITHVEGKAIAGMETGDAVKLLRGKPGSKVNLTIEREGEVAPLEITATRDIIQVSPVASRVIDNDIGYISLSQFSGNADKKMDEAINKIEQDTKGNVKGYILDFRYNPGGRVNQAVEIVDNFINSGPIVSLLGADGRGSMYTAEQGDMINGKPLVIMINGYSASASELVAGALQDHGRATILGNQSFGKGSAQRIIPLQRLRINDPGAIKLTSALYYTAKGRSIQGVGITPDIRTEFKYLTEIKAAVSEASQEYTIDNPNTIAAKDETYTKQVCMASSTPATAQDVSEEMILGTKKDGTKVIDQELLCAIKALKGQNPHVKFEDIPAPANKKVASLHHTPR